MRFSLKIVAVAGLLAQPAVSQTSRANLADRVMTLSRATRWTRAAAIPLRFKSYHPQGMVKVGDAFFLSAVEIERLPKKLAKPEGGHDYDAGAGRGHLFKFAADGTLLADLVIGEGTIYHPGGIDFDGRYIWVPVAEYRPKSRSIIYRVDPATMMAQVMGRVADHIGGIVHDRENDRLVGLSWGSRHFYTWRTAPDGAVETATQRLANNQESYIDYQDCHGLGSRLMMCAGVAEYQATPDTPAFQLGGIDLVDLTTLRPVWQTPVALWSPSGRAMTQNPFWIEPTAAGVRAWFVPDDDSSTLYVYDADTSATSRAAVAARR